MSSVALQGNASGTGAFVVTSPNSNSSRTLTLPDATTTIVGTDATQTLTNKTIDASQLVAASVTNTQLATAVKPVGVGQTWTDVTSSRALGTTYTNSTGRPIMIAVTITIPSQLNSYVTFSINGSIVGYFGANSAAQPALLDTTTLIIPDGATYRVATVTGSPSIQIWWELR